MTVPMPDAPPRERHHSFRVQKRRDEVPGIRARVCEVLSTWELESLSDRAGLAVSELAANAVRHCRVTLALIEVSVYVDGAALFVEVRDPDRERAPQQREPSEDEESGRGLLLVDACADRWGVSYQEFSKGVWASFALPGR
jgi:anti-sigma regulatory factor (Ser/Thr protein kinase)